MATVDQLIAQVRDEVGDQPDDDTVVATLDRFAVDEATQADRAALSILRRRRANLLDDRSFAVAGDTSWGAVAVDNLKALDAKIAEIRGRIGGDETPADTLPVVSSTPIVASSPGR